MFTAYTRKDTHLTNHKELCKGQGKTLEMEEAERQQATHLARGDVLGSKAKRNNPEAQAGKLSRAWS